MNNSSSLSDARILSRQPKQKRGQQRVEKILLAAAEVFAAVGYSAATTQQIADRANTAVGSVYQFFPNKLAIFHALEVEYINQMEDVNQEFFAVNNFHLPLKVLISNFVDNFADLLEHPVVRCMWLQSLQPPVPGLFVLLQDPDNNIVRLSIADHADFYRKRCPDLSRVKSELLSEVAHSISGGLYVTAFRSTVTRCRSVIYEELKDALYGYLNPHIGDRLLPSRHNNTMVCPACQSDRVAKNGHHQGKQRYICKACGRQFLDRYTPRGYPPETKQKCLELHQQGVSFREIERQTGVSHNTAINWVKGQSI
jgi:AcrR family transcriptional regulator